MSAKPPLASAHMVYAAGMNQDTDIQLSGPFKALDGSGRTVDIKSIRIFDEGYGVIDLYVDLATPATDGLHKDQKLIADISARLRALDAPSVHTNHKKFDVALLKRIHDDGYRVMLYTVNDAERARSVRDAGVDGLFTDELEAFAARFPGLIR